MVGHNPSERAWQDGYHYANPTNRLWPLLQRVGIVPPHAPMSAQNTLPSTCGIGFADVGVVPGNNAADFTRPDMLRWRQGFYARCRGHLRQCCAAAAADGPLDAAALAPRIVCFIGKRHWAHLFQVPLKKVQAGAQAQRPPGWPFPPSTACWVVNSPSGRNAVTKAALTDEYAALKAELDKHPMAASDAGAPAK